MLADAAGACGCPEELARSVRAVSGRFVAPNALLFTCAGAFAYVCWLYSRVRRDHVDLPSHSCLSAQVKKMSASPRSAPHMHAYHTYSTRIHCLNMQSMCVGFIVRVLHFCLELRLTCYVMISNVEKIKWNWSALQSFLSISRIIVDSAFSSQSLNHSQTNTFANTVWLALDLGFVAMRRFMGYGQTRVPQTAACIFVSGCLIKSSAQHVVPFSFMQIVCNAA